MIGYTDDADVWRPSPVEAALRARRRVIWLTLGALLALAALLLWLFFIRRVPETQSDPGDHFKYGSIGSDVDSGLPYWAWKVMPNLCPSHLAERGDGSGPGYEAFGFLSEPGFDRPIGFSKRRATGIELLGLNCAVCHTGKVRQTADATPEIVAGMPANQLDLLGYFEFLFDCAADPKFTVDNVMAHIDAATSLGVVERAIYQRAVPVLREALLSRAGRLAPLRTDRFRSGKGRIDTFNPYKALVLGFPHVEESAPGAVDFPSIWNQGIRRDMALHWDGNNDSLFERNISASIGAGVTPVSIDMPRVEQVAGWLEALPPPKYPGLAALDTVASDRGRAVYSERCASCHGTPENDWKGERVGVVEALASIGTDPSRLASYTYRFASNQWTIGAGQSWRFHHFRKTGGYVNMPLDGIWARAPYLHNGSVPTLGDLLARPPEGTLEARAAHVASLTSGGADQVERKVRESIRSARASGERPLAFYRGDDLLEPGDVGFVTDRSHEGERRYMLYATTREGHGNGGHTYGTDLGSEQKGWLVEYMKTF